MHHDYHITHTTLGQMSSSISLPPISAINFNHSQHGRGHAASQELSHHAIPPPARTLPLPYYSSMQAMPQPEYVQPARPMYAGVQTPYGMPMRMPLPSSSDTSGMMGYAPGRHAQKTKDVKRRTKTGCMTCRKRRIKVSQFSFPLPSTFQKHHETGIEICDFRGQQKVQSLVAPRG